MSANFHPLVYLIDYVMGMIMWTLIGRVAMNIFQREDSEFFFMKIFVKLTDPLINLFKPITPSFNEIKINPSSRSAKLRYATKISNKCDFNEFLEKFRYLREIEDLQFNK